MGLTQYVVDLLDIDCTRVITYRLNERTEGKVSCGAQDAFRASNDEGKRILSEDVCSESGGLELIVQEGFNLFGSELFEFFRISDAIFDFLVHRQREGVH